jgi:hypothetical protein
VLDQLAAVDDHDLVDGLRHLGEHVARDQDRPALARERPEEVAEPADALRVEAVRRLVQDEHLGIAEERGGQAEALPHPQRVALHAATAGLSEVDECQDLVHARARDPAGDGEHAEVVPSRPARMGVERLEQDPDAHDRVVELAVARAQDRRASRGRLDEAEDRAHRRRLARAVGAEEPRDPARADREREVVDGEGGAEPLREPVDLDHASTVT